MTTSQLWSGCRPSTTSAFSDGTVGEPLSSIAPLLLLRLIRHYVATAGRLLHKAGLIVRGGPTALGFHSTFRDWCAETTNYPGEVAEAALAHTRRDKTDAARQRGDLVTTPETGVAPQHGHSPRCGSNRSDDVGKIAASCVK